jgi:hypothetical protein
MIDRGDTQNGMGDEDQAAHDITRAAPHLDSDLVRVLDTHGRAAVVTRPVTVARAVVWRRAVPAVGTPATTQTPFPQRHTDATQGGRMEHGKRGTHASPRVRGVGQHPPPCPRPSTPHKVPPHPAQTSQDPALHPTQLPDPWLLAPCSQHTHAYWGQEHDRQEERKPPPGNGQAPHNEMHVVKPSTPKIGDNPAHPPTKST